MIMFFLVLSFHPSPNLLVLVFLFSCFLAFFLTVLFSHYHFLSSIPTLRFLPLYCLSCFCLLLSLCRLLFFLSLHLASCFPLAGPLSACLLLLEMAEGSMREPLAKTACLGKTWFSRNWAIKEHYWMILTLIYVSKFNFSTFTREIFCILHIMIGNNDF